MPVGRLGLAPPWAHRRRLPAHHACPRQGTADRGEGWRP